MLHVSIPSMSWMFVCQGFVFDWGHMFKFQVFIWGLMFKFQVHILVLSFVDVSNSCKFCLFALLMPSCTGRFWFIGFRF